MTWHLDFVAADKETALEFLTTASLPKEVFDLVKQAIKGLRDETNPWVTYPRFTAQKLIYVKGNGHLATGSDYEVTTCNLEVKWLMVATGLVEGESSNYRE